MQAHIHLHAELLTVTVQPGRRGCDVQVAGAISFGPGLCWEDATLFTVLLGDGGEILLMERNSLRFEDTQDQRLVFTDSARLASTLVARVSRVEVWASVLSFEVTDFGTASLETDLPAPGPGGVSLHTMGGLSLRRPPPDESGECRLTAYGSMPFDGGAAYDSRGELQLSLLDADGGAHYVDDGSFDTLAGQHGTVRFDVRFRPHISQLNAARRLVVRALTKRIVKSSVVGVEREDFTMVEDR